MRRGEIRLVELEPARGAEANKTRPAVIVSNDGANGRASDLGTGVVTVIPVTSNVGRVLAFQVRLPRRRTGLPIESKAQAEQMRAVDVERVGRRLGLVPHDLMQELDEAMRLHLAL